MEHPLISNIDHLNLDELQEKINELSRKLSMAHRSGNAHLRSQVQMALETYQNKFREKQQAEYDRATRNGPDFGKNIDIS